MYYCPSLLLSAARYLSIFTVNPVAHLLCCQAAFLFWPSASFLFFARQDRHRKSLFSLETKQEKSHHLSKGAQNLWQCPGHGSDQRGRCHLYSGPANDWLVSYIHHARNWDIKTIKPFLGNGYKVILRLRRVLLPSNIVLGGDLWPDLSVVFMICLNINCVCCEEDAEAK